MVLNPPGGSWPRERGEKPKNRSAANSSNAAAFYQRLNKKHEISALFSAAQENSVPFIVKN